MSEVWVKEEDKIRVGEEEEDLFMVSDSVSGTGEPTAGVATSIGPGPAPPQSQQQQPQQQQPPPPSAHPERPCALPDGTAAAAAAGSDPGFPHLAAPSGQAAGAASLPAPADHHRPRGSVGGQCDQGGQHPGGGRGPVAAPALPPDRHLPTANIQRIMKKALPSHAKVSREAKDAIQEALSEFISFVTAEASEKCLGARRKTINGDDLLWAIYSLGFNDYCAPLHEYLKEYREHAAAGKKNGDREDPHAGTTTTASTTATITTAATTASGSSSSNDDNHTTTNNDNNNNNNNNNNDSGGVNTNTTQNPL